MANLEYIVNKDSGFENSHHLFRNAPELEIGLAGVYNIGDFYRQNLVGELVLDIDSNFPQNQINIIDAACGNGRVLRSIKNAYSGSKHLFLKGFDSDPDSILEAYRRSTELEIDLETHDLLEINDSYEPNSVDVVILTGVLFYFSPAKLVIILNRVSKVLKSGGLIYFNLLPIKLFDSPEALLNKVSKIKWFEIYNPSNGYTDPNPEFMTNYGPYYFTQWNSKGRRSSGNGHPVWYYPKPFIKHELAKIGIEIQKCEAQFLPESIFQSGYYGKINPTIRQDLLRIPVCDLFVGRKS
jgi:SAM-dependent methyltransferase